MLKGKKHVFRLHEGGTLDLRTQVASYQDMDGKAFRGKRVRNIRRD